MSLESDIKKLTAAVEALTAAMQQTATSVAEPEQKAESKEMPTVREVYENSPPNPDVEPKAAAAMADSSMTKDKLQSWCIEKVRADKAFKQKLMGVLGEYDAKTINALPDDTIAEVYAKLGGQ